MENKSLKVLGTIAASAALAASIQTIALADPGNSSTLTSGSAITGTITADVLNVRSNPNTSSSVIGSLYQDTTISIIEMNNGWYKISYNNTTGWVSGEYINLNNSSTATSSGTVNADYLNVRAGASTGNKIIGSLTSGSAVNIISSSNGWCQIEFNGGTGFVSADFISTNSNPSLPPSDNSDSSNNGSTGTVNADSLNVRSGASTSNSIIGSLTSGSAVDIISSSNGWYQIEFNGGTGFVSADFISTNSNPSLPPSDNSDSSDNGTTGTVNADSLNVRSGASTSNSIIGSLISGTKVEILSTSNGWHKIKYNNTQGYVSSDYITPSSNDNNTSTPDDTPSHNVSGKVAIVTADALNVRSGAGTSYSVIATARYGSKLPIISASNGWYNVNLGSTTGYVSGDYVSITNEGDTSNPLVKETPMIESNYSGEDIVAKAEEYLGVPYLWGGFTPVGFDCSGLAQYVYKYFGIYLERTTYYQVHQGETVDRNNLMPGDLIFFTTNDDDPNDISHVGIYKGNDLFIQAPKPGDVVRVSNLNSAYYSKAYYIAKRIIK